MRQTTQQLSSKTLPLEAVKELRTAGFLDYEIEQFAKATQPIDLTIPTWQKAMKSRKEWIERMVAGGRSRARLKEIIMEFYMADKKHTPWDFLSHVYKPEKKILITADIISERIAKRR